MGEDKIRITREETQSAKVDVILKQQAALEHAQTHYQGAGGPGALPVTGTALPLPGVRGQSRIWYNSLVYMAIFGAIGGTVAWALGEIAWRVEPRELLQFQEAITIDQQLEAAVREGRLNQARADEIWNKQQEQLANNSYFKIASDQHLADDAKKLRIDAMRARDADLMHWISFSWLAICGALLGLALGLAEPIVSRNWRAATIDGSTGATLGLLGGIVLSFFAAKLYHAIGGGDLTAPLGAQMAARALAWASSAYSSGWVRASRWRIGNAWA